jgi:predicted AAA+ superfamily ATPase
MIRRKALAGAIRAALRRSRVVALIGPRQCGKTTMARSFLDADSPNYFDLEDPVSCARLEEPMTALRDLSGLVVIDEIQRMPDLFRVLRVLTDRERIKCRFLVLGSASPDLERHSSESLAGRIETIEMAGFCLGELGVGATQRLWLRGGFPLSYLAGSEADSVAWRRNFVRTFISRDLPLSGIRLPSTAMLRFWTMLAHYHGQTWNAAEPARSLGISESSVRRYLDQLTDLYIIRQLQPWHANLKKRQVKAPKIYFRDSGLAHFLLGIRTSLDLSNNPKYGASWEGFVVEEVIRATGPDEVFYWATHAGAELDLLMIKDGRPLGVECKRADAPALTASMRSALTDLKLDRLIVVYPGRKRYSLSENVDVVPLGAVISREGGLNV